MLSRHRIVDMHSHIGAGSSPALDGAEDTNSFKGCSIFFHRVLYGIKLTAFRTNLTVAPQPGWA